MDRELEDAIARDTRRYIIKLETENRELRFEVERRDAAGADLSGQVMALRAKVEQLTKECEEQARLNGMGGERELTLRAKVERLRALLRPFVDMVAEPEDFAVARAALADKGE